MPYLLTRAKASKLSTADRRRALDTLAFVERPSASKAMLAIAALEAA